MSDRPALAYVTSRLARARSSGVTEWDIFTRQKWDIYIRHRQALTIEISTYLNRPSSGCRGARTRIQQKRERGANRGSGLPLQRIHESVLWRRPVNNRYGRLRSGFEKALAVRHVGQCRCGTRGYTDSRLALRRPVANRREATASARANRGELRLNFSKTSAAFCCWKTDAFW